MDIPSSCAPNLLNNLKKILPDFWVRRCGSLRPAQVFMSIVMMTAEKHRSYRGLLEYLKRTAGDQLEWDVEPNASSLSEARRKLTKEQCLDAFKLLQNECAGIAGSPKVAYKNYRVCAVDMTTVALPAYKDIIREFQCPKDARGKTTGAPKGTLTALWDVSTNTPIDWRMEKVYSSERFAAHSLLESLSQNDLVIMDRGYPSRRILDQLINQKTAFLIRMTTGAAGGFKEVKEFADDKLAWDREVILHDNNQRKGEPRLRVRLMKRRLSSGQVAVFATNLYGIRSHKRRALCDLYCYRWDIETAFKEMKVWYKLENFSARYAEGIHQEVTGLMTYMLLVGEMEAQARMYHEYPAVNSDSDGVREPIYRFNRRQIAEYVGYIIAAAAKGEKALMDEFELSMNRLRRYRQRRRPGRKFERRAKDPNSKFKKSTYNTGSKQDS